jgi:hypothetical protein
MKFLRDFWMSLISFLLILILLIAPLFTLVIGYNMNAPFIVYISAFFLSFTIAFFIGWFLISKIGKYSINFFKKIFNELNGNLTTKLIALGITGFFLSMVPIQFLGALITFISSLLANLFTNVISSWTPQKIDICASLDSPKCLSELAMSLMISWTQGISSAYSEARISQLPFERVIIFFIVWLILVQLIYQINLLSKAPDKENWLRQIYTNSIARSNIVFFTILGVGLYLSIAAIAAIPSLQDVKAIPEAISVEKLEERINVSIKQFERKFPVKGDEFDPALNPFTQLSQVDPFSQLKTFLENKEEAKKNILTNANFSYNNSSQQNQLIKKENQQEIIKGIEIKLDNAKQQLQYQETNRKSLFEFENSLVISTRKEMKEILKSAIAEYEVSSVDRKGSRQTAEHYLNLINWIDLSSNELESKLNNCFRQTELLDSRWQDWSDTLRSTLLSNGEIYNSDITDKGHIVEQNLQAVRRYCPYSVDIDVSSIPKRPSLGAYLGPFSIVASWLLRTESLPLALITGLLGFGLLGSACSSFVRERISETIQKREGSPLVQDLSKVIIIGLSAAILAFLSVMGGLAVFFSSGTNPNPYALLLACLIAAAFGEDVWRWARNQLEEKLKDKSDKPSVEKPPEVTEQQKLITGTNPIDTPKLPGD